MTTPLDAKLRPKANSLLNTFGALMTYREIDDVFDPLSSTTVETVNDHSIRMSPIIEDTSYVPGETKRVRRWKTVVSDIDLVANLVRTPKRPRIGDRIVDPIDGDIWEITDKKRLDSGEQVTAYILYLER